MSFTSMKEDLYQAILNQLKEFSKTNENSDIYAISFDVGEFNFVTRFNSEPRFLKDYKDKADIYKSFGDEYYENKTLTGPKYESGDFIFLNTIVPMKKLQYLDDFFDSMAYYVCGYIDDEKRLIPKEHMPEEIEAFLIDALTECAIKLIDNIDFIKKTDDFIIYVSPHDISDDKKLELMSKTIGASLFYKLCTK